MSLIFFKGKPDLNTSLPVRQTASIFKQPVTKVTNHPNNKVKTDPQKAVDQPRQVNLLCQAVTVNTTDTDTVTCIAAQGNVRL